MNSEELKVVLDEELEQLLKSLGLFSRVESGEILCAQCGTPISLATLGAICAQQDGYLVICSNRTCMDTKLGLRGE